MLEHEPLRAPPPNPTPSVGTWLFAASCSLPVVLTWRSAELKQKQTRSVSVLLCVVVSDWMSEAACDSSGCSRAVLAASSFCSLCGYRVTGGAGSRHLLIYLVLLSPSTWATSESVRAPAAAASQSPIMPQFLLLPSWVSCWGHVVVGCVELFSFAPPPKRSKHKPTL